MGKVNYIVTNVFRNDEYERKKIVSEKLLRLIIRDLTIDTRK